MCVAFLMGQGFVDMMQPNFFKSVQRKDGVATVFGRKELDQSLSSGVGEVYLVDRSLDLVLGHAEWLSPFSLGPSLGEKAWAG